MAKIIGVFVFSFIFTAQAEVKTLAERVQLYGERYGLENVNEKKVNNRGNGFEELYGTRNFRRVLKGVFYRGGANNYYHRESPRDNRNPLMREGLENLCREGFGSSVYLYSRNFETAPTEVSCSKRGFAQPGNNSLAYSQVSPLFQDRYKQILRMIYANIQNPNAKPIYGHCWNGWHASGFISAVTLKQFCNFTAQQAVEYWDANTDGVNTNPRYERIREKIRNFTPDPELTISAQARRLICP